MGALIINESIEAKPYTDCDDLIYWHFYHTVNRSVKVVNFVSAIYENWKISLSISDCWSKTVRIGNTQKRITTIGTNLYCKILIGEFSEPEEKLKRIYDILQSKYKLFTKRKSVVHKPESKKMETQQHRLLLSG
ncbi:MAG: hypothetical protein ABI325_05620 [Ginsengibacter sp.]